MLGLRGCRLGNTFPEITAMQTKAILGAAVQLKKEGFNPKPEIMVPLVGIVNELDIQENIIRKTANKLFKKEGVEVEFKVGTMIEIPRAALTADVIAQKAEYFSFGTNDLTQMTFGYSRDDIASFLPSYLEKKILDVDPFQVLDQKGVGQLIQMGVEKGRKTRKNLKCGICGEHGGEPSSVKFCHRVGLNYVSCSPFRVPIARLAAAQAAGDEMKEFLRNIFFRRYTMFLRRYTAYFLWFINVYLKEVESLPFALTSNLLSSLQQSYFIPICNLLNQCL